MIIKEIGQFCRTTMIVFFFKCVPNWCLDVCQKAVWQSFNKIPNLISKSIIILAYSGHNLGFRKSRSFGLRQTFKIPKRVLIKRRWQVHKFKQNLQRSSTYFTSCELPSEPVGVSLNKSINLDSGVELNANIIVYFRWKNELSLN